MKKNRKSETYKDGVEAAWAGKEKDDCRFDDDEERASWLEGFLAAIATIKRCCGGKKDD